MIQVETIVTLGVLSFNNEHFLEQLFDSIVNQDSKDFELIIIDNNSSDSSWIEIQAFMNRMKNLNPGIRMRIFRNPINTRSIGGTQELFRHCETEYLAIIHGDDLLAETYVSSVKTFVRMNRTVDAFNVDLIEIDFVGSPTGKVLKSLWSEFNRVNNLLVAGLNPGLMPGSVIRKLSTNSFCSLEAASWLNGNEDTLLWITILRQGGIIRRFSLPIYHYRRHENQLTNATASFSRSLGFCREFNVRTAPTRLQSIIARSEIKFEVQSVLRSEYLRVFHAAEQIQLPSLRIISILIRRFAQFLQK